MWIFRSHFLQAFYGLFLIILGGFSWLSLDDLPGPIGQNGDKALFSAERALTHVKRLAMQPRKLSTSAHDVARDYILGELSLLGCSVSLQKTFTSTHWRYGVFSGDIENIICVFPGKNPDALMLMTHYDSVHLSPGAADSAAGVSILLESARALKEHNSENTLVLLFTDGEESGLLGASAFVKSEVHKRFHVRTIMNFEARGNSGPLALFETHHLNSFSALALAKVENPFGNSFLDLLYQFLPNDTDVSVFKNLGIPTLNFAFARGLQHYHHSSDNAENLSPKTLQHAGNTALHASQYFLGSKLSASQQDTQSVIYQDILGKKHLSYPGSLLKGLSILMIVGIVFCLWAWQVHLGKLIVATLLCSVFLGASLVSAHYFQKVAAAIWTPVTVTTHFYLFFAVLVLVPLSFLHMLFLKIKRKFPDLQFGLLLLLLALCVGVQYAPGLGTLVVWSSLGVLIFCIRPTQIWRNLALFPVFLLLPQFLHTALIADSGTQFGLPVFILCLGVALLHLCFLNPYQKVSKLTHESPEITKLGCYPVVHASGMFFGLMLLALLYTSLLPREAQKRVDFFEVFTGKKLYVALSKNADTRSLLENEISNAQKALVLENLWRWRIQPQLFSLFETNSLVDFPTEVDMAYWPKANEPTQYLIDVPIQNYDCVSVSLLNFENITELKINSQRPFAIPAKRFTPIEGPYFVESCSLRKIPLRIEFQLPAGQNPAIESSAIFLRNTLSPKEFGLDPENTIMGNFSNTLYVLKKITL